MRFPLKTLGLLLASLAFAGCGGGGGDGGGAASPAANGKITLSATRTALPLNPGNVLPYPGSPYMAEVSVSFRNSAGTLTSPVGDATYTISSPSVASISPPDDPATDDINEMATRMVSFHETMNNGSSVVFVNSYDVAGTATLTVSAMDPITNRTVTSTLNFTVAGATPLPASVQMSSSPNVIYVNGMGGPTNAVLTAQVRDGANQFVPNPGENDNVRFEIIENFGGATLSATSASGPASGTSVTTRTVNGVAMASLQAGSAAGPVRIRVTADRADNNVSNGISDPVSANGNVVISDGKLHSLKITSPDVDAIDRNSVFYGYDAEGQPLLGFADGTYTLSVNAVASDAMGNPVAPGTVIQFGLVNEPAFGFPTMGAGQFHIQGSDGNPREGGVQFTAPAGQFRTAGGGVNPGDTLLLFGKSVTGNSELENVRTVQSVASQTSLNTTRAFNRNDGTGSIVDYGNVIPYVIGRGGDGVNITASAKTNSLGVASVNMTYPVSRLGKATYIWAQGNVSDSVVKTVADIELTALPGIAPLTVAVSPSPLQGNTTTGVTVCVKDAYDSPMQGVRVSFSFHDMGIGSGSIDGVSGAGLLAQPTGSNGCVSGVVRTAGLSSEDESGVNFSVGDSEPVDVPLTVGSGLALQAAPSTTSGGPITLLLTDGSGNPVPGTQIVGTCTGGPGITGLIAATGADGKTVAMVTAGGLEFVCPGDTRAQGVCKFSTTATGGPTVEVTVLGPVAVGPGFSPLDPAQCAPGP